jgi:O-antigen/teichoic acid export membrane protein
MSEKSEIASFPQLSIKKIFGLSSIYGITPILDRALSLLLLPIFTHYLSTDRYGSLVLLYASANLVQLFIFMGFSGTLQKLYWDYSGKQRKECLGTAWITTLGLNLLAGIPLVVFSNNIAVSFFHNRSVAILFVLIIARISLSTQSIIPIVVLRSNEKKFHLLFANLLSISVRVGLTILFLTYLKLDLIGVLLADICSNIATLLIYVPVLLRQIIIKFEWGYLREILMISPYQFIVEVLAWIIDLSDRLLIQYILKESSEVAVYAVGYTFGSAILFLVNPILIAWRPYIYSVYTSSQENYAKQMGQFLFYFIIICSGSFVIISALSNEFIRILTPSVYHRATSLVTIVLIAHVMATISNYFLSTFFIVKKMQMVAVVYMISAITNVGFNLVLIPKMGIIAAAVATLISYGIMAGMIYIKSQRLMALSVNVRPIFLTVIVAASVWFLLMQIDIDSAWVSLVVKMVILFSVLSVAALWIYKQRQVSLKMQL